MSEVVLNLDIKPAASIRERVYQHLRTEILSGRIPPGARMVEGRLAGQVGASRTPVREALHVLETEGLVEATPRVGYRVKALLWDEVEEIVAIRAVNESLALRWAMKNLTPQTIQALEENLGRAEETLRAGRPDLFVDLDAGFHDLLVGASGSSRLMELCHNLRRYMLRYRVGSFYASEVVALAIQGHRRILERLKNQDLRGAVLALKRHLRESKRSIKRFALREAGL